MATGGALSYNGVDGLLAAGVAGAIPPIPQSVFFAITAGELCGSGEPLDDVGFMFGLPPIDTDFNVLVNGYAMTVKDDMFGTLSSFGNVGDSEPICNPTGDFTVPDEASISNVLVNGIKAAVPNTPPLTTAPIVDKAKMAMQTAQTNVILYW